MNLIWGWMLAAGIAYGTLTGRLGEVTQAVLDGAGDAVSLAITMAGMMAFWSGIMRVGQRCGIIEAAAKVISPVLDWLFPDIPKTHPARASIAVNCIANLFGLGWAATPAGLKAMEALASLEEERRHAAVQPAGQQQNGRCRRGNRCLPVDQDTASKEMCTFLILNISSLQLIPVNIIAYRSQYGSASATGIVGPAIMATMASTLAAMVFCRIMHHISTHYH